MRDQAIERLRKLRRRAEALNATLSDDLRRFVHEVDGKTFRRLPWSLSVAEDVSVASTCTALMALSATHELERFYGLPKPSVARSLRAAGKIAEAASRLIADNPEERGDDFLKKVVTKLEDTAKTVVATARLKDAPNAPNSEQEIADAVEHVRKSIGKALQKLDELLSKIDVEQKDSRNLRNAKDMLAEAETNLHTEEEISSAAREPEIALRHETAKTDRMRTGITMVGNAGGEKEPSPRDVTSADPEGEKSEGLARWVEEVRSVFASLTRARWTSSLLPQGNAFTASVVLRTAGLLSRHRGVGSLAGEKREELTDDKSQRDKFQGKEMREIAKCLASEPAQTLKVKDYPAASAVAYWLVDAFDNLAENLQLNEWRNLSDWASREFARQESLVTARHHAMMDPVAMAMAACLIARLSRLGKRSNLDLSGERLEFFVPPLQLRHSV